MDSPSNPVNKKMKKYRTWMLVADVVENIARFSQVVLFTRQGSCR